MHHLKNYSPSSEPPNNDEGFGNNDEDEGFGERLLETRLGVLRGEHGF